MKHLIFLALALFASTLFAQNTNDVTLTVVGSGKTIEEAKTNALRSAIEQAYGAFVSSNTEILNDEIVKDEIVSISSGNIKEFKILSQSELTEDLVSMTLSATVSVSQLQSYAQSKGATVEFAGGLFAMNIKMQKLNSDAEIAALYNALTALSPLAFQAYDFEIEPGQPKSKDGSNDNWIVPFTVKATANSNMLTIYKTIFNQLKSISLTENEKAKYKELQLELFEIRFSDGKIFSFRNSSSKRILEYFFRDLFLSMPKHFVVDNGHQKSNGHLLREFEAEVVPKTYYTAPIIPIEKQLWLEIEDRLWREKTHSILSSAKFSFSYADVMPLEDIEKISAYKAVPMFSYTTIGVWKSGGVLFYILPDGRELIMDLFNYKLPDNYDDNPDCEIELLTILGKEFLKDPNIELAGKLNTERIVKNCDSPTPSHFCYEGNFHGYNDWFCPSLQELQLIAEMLVISEIGTSSYLSPRDIITNYDYSHNYSFSSSWNDHGSYSYWWNVNFEYAPHPDLSSNYLLNSLNTDHIYVRPIRIE